MKYSISNWIYGPEPVEKAFKRVSKFNYDGIEIVGEPTKINIKEMLELSKKYNIKITSMAGQYNWSSNDSKRDFSNPDIKERNKAIDYMCECLEICKTLGAKCITFLPNSVGKTKPSISMEKDWENSVKATKEAAKVAEKLGIFIAVEPINRYEAYLVNNVNQGLKYVYDCDSPAVKIMLDCFHMNIEEQDLTFAIRQAKDLMVNFHVADSNRQTVGRGNIDFKTIVHTLIEIDYKGYVTLEPLPPIADPSLALELEQSEEISDIFAKEAIELLKLYEEMVLI